MYYVYLGTQARDLPYLSTRLLITAPDESLRSTRIQCERTNKTRIAILPVCESGLDRLKCVGVQCATIRVGVLICMQYRLRENVQARPEAYVHKPSIACGYARYECVWKDRVCRTRLSSAHWPLHVI